MENLLDTSWSLHFISTNSIAYRNLFNPSTTQNHLSRYFDKLPDFLSSQKPQYVDDLNDENEKLGTLHDCKYTIFYLSKPSSSSSQHPPPPRPSPTIRIQLIYQNSTFTFTLYTPNLILSKGSATHTKNVLTFLSETFSISIDQLKLPSSLLSASLQSYIATLASSLDYENDDFASSKRTAILRTAIGTLKITISFMGPVAPHLRTVDISLPYETVDALWSASEAKGEGFMHSLAGHIHLQTGLRLPLSLSDDGETMGAGVTDGRASPVTDLESLSEPPLKMTKMTCAAFAISVEGKLRFAGKAIENAVEYEDLVVDANVGMLDGVVVEARSTRRN